MSTKKVIWLKTLAETINFDANKSARLLGARNKDALARKSLNKLKIIAWFRTLCSKAGALAYSDSALKTRFDHTKWPDGLSHIDWRPYARGQQKPSITTLKIVDKAFPGTKLTYELGPFGMWAILAGDIAACNVLINKHVSTHISDGELLHGIPFVEKVNAFKKLLISPKLTGQFKPAARLPHFSDELNPVNSTYIGVSMGTGSPKSLPTAEMSESLILATVALSQVATHQYECFIEADHLMFGLFFKAIPDKFPVYGDYLVEYMYRQFHWRPTAFLRFGDGRA